MCNDERFFPPAEWIINRSFIDQKEFDFLHSRLATFVKNSHKKIGRTEAKKEHNPQPDIVVMLCWT